MKKSVGGVFVIAAILASVSSAALLGQGAKEKSLYDRLGGKAAVSAVVDEFVARVAADKRINAYFGSTASDPARLMAFKGKLVDQICQASGGPCTYTGKDMKTAHVGMNIKDADFNALVEDLKASLDHFKVPAKEQQELIGTLAPMHDAIVTAK